MTPPPAAASTAEPRTLAPLGRRLADITANRRVGAYSVISALDGNGPRDPRPGQFYMLAAEERWGGDGERPLLPRAFSYARAGADGRLEFLLEAVGPGTRRLAELQPGERVWLAGPFGIGFRQPPPGARPLLAGGGIGTAPLICLRDELGQDTRVLLGFRSGAHAEIVSELHGHVAVATDDGSVGRRALVTELLREELDGSGERSRVVYACGPPAMLEAVRAICAERDVAAQLALESGMACGYGACFGCVVPTRTGYVRLCVDGPVLDAGELESALIPGGGH